MRSVQLQAALSAFVEQAAALLHADVLAGQEVPFELEARSARLRGASLYCYQPLTGVFIAERMPALRRLDAYDLAARLLDCHDALDRYLLARGKEPLRGGSRLADVALLALLEDVFAEQTDFDCAADERSERLRRALERLDGAMLPSPSEVTLVATLHGLAISSPDLRLTRGLLIAQPDALHEAPDQALPADGGSRRVPPMGYRSPIGGAGGERDHLLVVHTAEHPSPSEGVAEGAEVVRDLLQALRLFGDGRIVLGAHAYARIGDGQWTTLALGAGGRPHGMLLVTADQEDELRAFCNLVSRRAPHGDRIAWALRRFELGCDRPNEYEGLSDHLLALRALLGDRRSCRSTTGRPSAVEAEAAPDGLVASRLAALCAVPERRAQLTQRTLAAIDLERQATAGTAVERAGSLAIVRDLADHLRALLRDVICGHLDSDLAGLADELLLSGDPLQALAGDLAEHPGEGDTAEQLALPEEQVCDDGQAAEILRVAV